MVVPEIIIGDVCTTGGVGIDTGTMVLAEDDIDRVLAVGIGTDAKCDEISNGGPLIASEGIYA